MRVYERDPQAIYKHSFEIIDREVDFSGFDFEDIPIARRMIHACGWVDLVEDIVFGGSPMAAGRGALMAGRPIICDVKMVEHGIIETNLPAGNEVCCAIGEERTRLLAKAKGNTRSAAGLELSISRFEGAIMVIGNAPTALFHLLDLIDEGAPKPAMIIGCPVGFVGAVESKCALIEQGHNIPFVTVRGRMGGSAIAAAALNAIARSCPGAQTP